MTYYTYEVLLIKEVSQMHYNSIATEITQRTKLSELQGRYKVNLCWQLLTDLGITQKMWADKELYEKFQVVWKEQTEKFW